ncbi:carboxylic ester hydrolase [Streptomyces sulfonofaciens]|uniref:Carboxylic ester hydrolase n=1 Tax=Streptomyces sulfonofaciens TaxID=68272 RepID=A0A919GKM3_9ACTN|nr:carboxylesterase family protein [Streptomyces sulfonofaciens]GHH86362.1 carboxylic ester hydrolase [Streptomyces sulfonofaciens]
MRQSPEVRTANGVVRGRYEGRLALFRGIPFAQPPLGPRRFSAPKAAEPWDGVRDADRFGPSVPQSTVFADPASPAPVPDGSGDWLTLNVWSPDPGTANLPVMVWIHGGAYLMGTSADPMYDGSAIAREGVVYVSLNYRVGMEGFAHIEGAPDNRGLLDQVAALRWVRQNIAAFGGDPGNITVFGQSAGAGSIAALLAMPSARGLFRRAVAQSVPGTFLSRALAADVGATVAGEFGLRPTVSDLATVPPARLQAAGDAVTRKMAEFADRWGVLSRTPTPYSPVVDGDVLPASPWDALRAGASRDVDLLAGHTRDEFRLFTTLNGGGPRGVTAEQAAAALEAFGPGPTGGAAYRTAHPTATFGRLHELVSSDWFFRMPTLKLAEAHAAGGGRTRMYTLDWSPTPLGAAHSLDTLLVLGNLRGPMLSTLLLGPDPGEEAERVSRDMRDAWVRFAATGEPGWPRFDGRRRLTRVYDREASTVPYPEETSRSIWADHEFGVLGLRRC